MKGSQESRGFCAEQNSGFPRCPRTALQSCRDRFENCFDGAKIPHRVWPREARGGRKSKFGPNIFVGLLVSCPRM